MCARPAGSCWFSENSDVMHDTVSGNLLLCRLTQTAVPRITLSAALDPVIDYDAIFNFQSQCFGFFALHVNVEQQEQTDL